MDLSCCSVITVNLSFEKCTIALIQCNSTDRDDQAIYQVNQSDSSTKLSDEVFFDNKEISSSKNAEDNVKATHKLLSKKKDWPAYLHHIAYLFKLYKSSLQIDECPDSSETRRKLIEAITAKATAYEVEIIAHKLRKRSKHVEASVLYSIAAAMYGSFENQDDGLKGIIKCMEGIKFAVCDLPSQNNEIKKIAEDRIIPIMVEMKDQIKQMAALDNQTKIRHEALCLHFISLAKDAVGDRKSFKALIEEALALLKEEFKDAANYQLFGVLLNNQGVAMERETEFAQAEELFNQCLEVYRKVKDYKTEKAKSSHLSDAEKNLKIVKMKKLQKQKMQK
ncbi:unnamed protein product [Clavelina lepadiformis]|uniref:Uncharacterized protein n=1 Tax=Clavelina lepadiformis TaxID=159417 RepID=A0ABP0FEX1_CLALP